MTDQDIERVVREAFQETGLILSDAKAVMRANLPPSTVRFLLHVGLPVGRIGGFEFGCAERLPPISMLSEVEQGGDTDAEDRAHCVGDAYGVLMVIMPTKDWNVWMVDPQMESQDMFVNSRVELLGASLAEYALLRRRHGKQYGPRIAEDLKLRLAGVDEPAIDGWWGSVIQEVEFGLM